MTTRYATREQAIEQLILPALGEYADEYDVRALSYAVLEYDDGYDPESGKFHVNRAGWCVTVAEDEFWDAVDRYDLARWSEYPTLIP